MIPFLISSVVYVFGLLLIKPAPNSLKAMPLTYAQNFKLIRASLCSGVFLLFVFLVISNYSFLVVDEHTYNLLALNNELENAILWPFQSITHLIIHANPTHLLANVFGIGLASVYERRVGAKRFLSVLAVGCIASIPSIFFYSDTIAVSGTSGGVFGLAAAYFTDEDELTIKEWGTAILLFAFLMFIFSLEGVFKSTSNESMNIQVDHIGHILGALGAIIYCRFKPLRLTSQ
ncbi:MAG: rhomboid family intramembrane serine protease [Saccharospirillaceae bacterium]|nr:rhomboid family intramembrane serine protease [Saccharospirillaceae bacterium]